MFYYFKMAVDFIIDVLIGRALSHEISSIGELLLFSASRAELVQEVIMPSVLSDVCVTVLVVVITSLSLNPPHITDCLCFASRELVRPSFMESLIRVTR